MARSSYNHGYVRGVSSGIGVVGSFKALSRKKDSAYALSLLGSGEDFLPYDLDPAHSKKNLLWIPHSNIIYTLFFRAMNIRVTALASLLVHASESFSIEHQSGRSDDVDKETKSGNLITEWLASMPPTGPFHRGQVSYNS